MRIFVVEPYYTGSHRAWADGWQAVSRHEIHLLTMEGRFWKWRMHGGPVTLADEAVTLADRTGPPNVLVASSMLDLATFIGLTGAALGNPPSLLYMHENQLTYPLSPRTRGEDLSYGFINWRSMIAADQVVFNTHFHREAFFDAVVGFLKNFPDYRQLDLVEPVRAKTSVVGVGVPVRSHRPTKNAAPLILWNQRWEYDKNPTELFEILYAVADAGIDFRLAVTGENFRQTPAEFEDALRRLKDQIVQFGYATASDYAVLVEAADIVISTALHEFFGVAVTEAMAAGAFPVLPRRLSYPELLPESVHPTCLYDSPGEAVRLLSEALTDPDHRAAITDQTVPAAAAFSWHRIGAIYDELVEQLAPG